MKVKAKNGDASIPFALTDYFELVDWVGRAIREDKRGHITDSLPPILNRLGIDADTWLQTMRPKGERFVRAVGSVESLRLYAESAGKCWLHGMALGRRVFGG